MQPRLDHDERRKKIRFPLRLAVGLVAGSHRSRASRTLTGNTENVSSNGFLIETESPLFIGERIFATFDWLASLNGTVKLRLETRGEVLRVYNGGLRAAVSIKSHQFKTRGSANHIASSAWT
ncbi:MAG: PilZ domain-containing protein [Patescibacteria group bacterium]